MPSQTPPSHLSPLPVSELPAPTASHKVFANKVFAQQPHPQTQETHSLAQERQSLGSPAETVAAPLGLLPTPTPDEVEGFARLYERKYGATLESDQARRLLSGLMRFLYLTRTASPNADRAAPSDAAGSTPTGE